MCPCIWGRVYQRMDQASTIGLYFFIQPSSRPKPFRVQKTTADPVAVYTEDGCAGKALPSDYTQSSSDHQTHLRGIWSACLPVSNIRPIALKTIASLHQHATATQSPKYQARSSLFPSPWLPGRISHCFCWILGTLLSRRLFYCSHLCWNFLKLCAAVQLGLSTNLLAVIQLQPEIKSVKKKKKTPLWTSCHDGSWVWTAISSLTEKF